MDVLTLELAKDIGEKVRTERQLQRLTLEQLADAAGVSRRLVINLEQGVTNPSVGTLLRISDALGIGLPALVERSQANSAVVTRSGSGATLWRGEAGGRGVLVAGTNAPEVLELWDWTLGAGDLHVSEAHAAGTKELIQVLDGAVTVIVAGETNQLGAGDAISFAGDVEHSYSNPGLNEARFTLSVYEPKVGKSNRSVVANG